MPVASTCTACGASLSDAVLAGLCPTCVRRFAMAEPLLPGDTAACARRVTTPPGGWEPPSAREVAALLPAGAYRVERLIGRGGMGAVYKGWQTSLERYVAIKILPPGFEGGDADFAARFRREARVMAKLKHPGIVPVHDSGETADGLLYFVMDFVEGTDVQQMIAARGRLPPREALSIAARVLEALASAHQNGIIHRDIKPANILVDAAGHVLVADFGLARSTEADETLFASSHLAMGTPYFMAPEARQGTVQVDLRADLYAVGVMLYQMLTGELPSGRFLPPSRLVPGLDKRLDRIVDRTLQVERDFRYSSAMELKAAIEPILARARRFGDKPVAANRLRSAALIAAAVITTSGWFAWQKQQVASPGPPDISHGFPNGGSEDLAEASRDAPFVNSLGMKFVPVPIAGGPTDGQRVLFSVWETRVQDFEAFIRETQREWVRPSFAQEPVHPVVMVTWDEATAFCVWLTERERKAGKLDPTGRYRLPSDHEWSCAVGIGEREDAALPPWEKHDKLGDVYGGGSQWPPPAGAGNFSGEETAGREINKPHQRPLSGYTDEFVATAPVGSFSPNRLGLHDLAGNVWEWCEEWCDAARIERLKRGGGWDTHSRGGLRSSLRTVPGSGDRGNSHGFRIVLDVDWGGTVAAPPGTPLRL